MQEFLSLKVLSAKLPADVGDDTKIHFKYYETEVKLYSVCSTNFRIQFDSPSSLVSNLIAQ